MKQLLKRSRAIVSTERDGSFSERWVCNLINVENCKEEKATDLIFVMLLNRKVCLG